MTQSLNKLQETPSQTSGPFVHIGCMPNFADINGVYPEDIGCRAIEEGAKGQIITVSGLVLDGTGWPLRDAMLETWQADSFGLYAGQEGCDRQVNGFCRFAADANTGKYSLKTVKPGGVPMHDGRMQSPHISVWIVARGINMGLHTRIYFDDEANDSDPLLSQIEQRPRVNTLIARKSAQGEYQFDIRLQGKDETVFLDI